MMKHDTGRFLPAAMWNRLARHGFAFLLALAMCFGTVQLAALSAKAVEYTSYKSTVTFYPGDGEPTGVNMNVGAHYKGNWYVASISTAEVTFGSQYGEHNNLFTIPAPEMIWTGVSHDDNTVAGYSSAFNGDRKVGEDALLIYTGGKATFRNVVNSPDVVVDPVDPGDPVPPSGPYVTVVHTYYTNNAYDGEYKEYQKVTAPSYDNAPKGIYKFDITSRVNSYNGKDYAYASMYSDPSHVTVAKGASGHQGTFTLRYERFETVSVSYVDRGLPCYHPESCNKGSAVTVKTCPNMRSNYVFVGWDTKPDADTAVFSTGSELTVNKDVVFYAVWQKALSKFVITVNFVDPDNNPIATRTFKITEGDPYDMASVINNAPEKYGYGSVTGTSGSPVSGIANSAKTIIVTLSK